MFGCRGSGVGWGDGAMKKTKSLEELEAERAEWVSFWHDRLRRNEEFIDGIARDGIKYSLIAHSAVAIICFQAYLSPEAAKLRNSLLFLLLCAFVGLVMSALGQTILLEGLTHFNGKVRGRLIRKKHMRFLAAIPTYGERVMGRSMNWSARLIYGSVCWLGIYLFAGLNMLANAWP
jgi:hypothetical protein